MSQGPHPETPMVVHWLLLPPDAQVQMRIDELAEKTRSDSGERSHERDAFPPESINASVDYRPDLSRLLGGRDLRPMPTIEPRVISAASTSRTPLEIQEHRGHPGWCSHCQKEFEAPWPIGVERAAWLGPRLTDRLPQGSLPRVVLHRRPQVHSRRGRGDDLAAN